MTMTMKHIRFLLLCAVPMAVFPHEVFATVSTNLPFIDRIAEVYDIVTGPVVVWISVFAAVGAGVMFMTARWFEAFGMVAKLLIGVSLVTGAVAYVGTEYGQSISALF